MKYFIGCDLGGTNLRVAIIDVTTGGILSKKSALSKASSNHVAVIEQIFLLIQDLVDETNLLYRDLEGIGIGIPGIVDLKHDKTIFLPNFADNWQNIPLGELFKLKTDLTTKLINDVQATIFGEWFYGAGERKETIALLAIGTGIGGGLFVNGKLFSGAGGMAGAFGHMVLEPDGPKCVCGSNGCLELYASGTAISAFAKNEINQGKETLIKHLCHNEHSLITPEIIATAANDGDELANEIYKRAGNYLGIAICNIITTISPQRIIVTGGVAKAANLILDPIKENIKTRIHPLIANKVDVVISQLGDDAGIIGSACWAANYINKQIIYSENI